MPAVKSLRSRSMPGWGSRDRSRGSEKAGAAQRLAPGAHQCRHKQAPQAGNQEEPKRMHASRTIAWGNPRLAYLSPPLHDQEPRTSLRSRSMPAIKHLREKSVRRSRRTRTITGPVPSSNGLVDPSLARSRGERTERGTCVPGADFSCVAPEAMWDVTQNRVHLLCRREARVACVPGLDFS